MIAYVVAYSKNRVIGKDGKLPWHLPLNDICHFKNITEGNTVVMGRQTYLSIGKPLPNRKNIVMTRSKDFRPAGVEVVHTKVEEVLAYPERPIYHWRSPRSTLFSTLWIVCILQRLIRLWKGIPFSPIGIASNFD